VEGSIIAWYAVIVSFGGTVSGGGLWNKAEEQRTYKRQHSSRGTTRTSACFCCCSVERGVLDLCHYCAVLNVHYLLLLVLFVMWWLVVLVDLDHVLCML